MKTKPIAWLPVLIFAANLVTAQLSFVSDELSEIHKQLIKNFNLSREMKLINHESNFKTYLAGTDDSEDKIRLDVYEDTLITHLGLNIFNEYPKQHDMFIYQFLERYLLIKLGSFNLSSLERSKYKNVLFSLNGKTNAGYSKAEWSSILKGNFLLSADDQKFTAEWKDDSGAYIYIEFPRNVDLFSGMDKYERDNYFMKLITENKHNISYDENVLDTNSLEKMEENLFLKKGGIFLEGFSSDNYYERRDNQFNLIFDKENSFASISNAMANPKLMNEFPPLWLKYFRYGVIDSFYVDFENLLAHLNKSTECFTGFEELNGKTTVTAIFLNKDLQTVHLLYIKSFATKDFFENNKKLTAQLYSYIRADNVNELFKKFRSKNSTHDIKIN
ncbi:MAG: hypothetical protein KJ799_16190 [Bacteroidetes bacterium]|nr:hypothetical protein [Bacteroidota bacterium]